MKLFTRHTLFDFIDDLVPTTATIVEAGAFDGTDTQRLAQWRPQGHIHAFEPVPEIYSILQANTAEHANITCYPIALSDCRGTRTFYISEHPKHPGKLFQAGSLCAPKERLNRSPVVYPRTTNVPTITLDEWAVNHNVNQIDFLWLDVQGHAFDILQASPSILKTISVLYVEVEFIKAYESQATYRELVAWLIQKGFTAIGRDFRTTADWFFGNLVLSKKKKY